MGIVAYWARGYLRFQEMRICSSSTAGIPVLIRREGPAYVLVEFETAPTVDRADIEPLARAIFDKIAVFVGQAFRDVSLHSLTYTPEESSEHDGSLGAVFLGGVSDNDPLLVPFANSHDHSEAELMVLRRLLEHAVVPSRQLVDQFEYMVAASDPVDAFMTGYAILERIHKRKRDVDDWVIRMLPGVEARFDSREKRKVTIFSRLRNAKGHTTDIPPKSVPRLMIQYRPQLQMLARAAILETLGVAAQP